VRRAPGVTADQFSYSTAVGGRRGHPEGALVGGLFNAVDGWTALLAEWIEVLAEQDTGRPGSAIDGVHVSAQGLTLWTVEESLRSFPASDHRITVNMRTAPVIDPPLWRRILRQVAAGRPVPQEHLLLADARAWLARNQFRRAIIDAGTAVELALTRRLDAALSPLEADLQRNLSAEHRTLGRLGGALRDVIDVDDLKLRRLTESRNKAVHANLAPSRDEARDALDTALQVVSLVEPLEQFR
jgi:hypothetical protein